MTEKEQIQNQIQELQEKLRKLEEVENEKMEFKDEGRFHFFHYNGKPYQRLEYTVIPNVSWFESLSTLEYPIPVYEKVMNSKLNKKLEELYQKQIVPEEPEVREWDVVRESMNWCKDHPGQNPLDWVKPQTPEQVADGLKEAFREAVKQGVVSSTKSQTLYDVIADWWDDTFTKKETSLQELVDRIEEWLPKEHDTNSYEWNKCIRMIRENLR